MFEQVRFDERGLVPCVAQDAASGEVLTLAYANEEALRLTVETGELHFFSRSREEIWRKGEESGNVLRLRQLRYDCDGDAIVALVEPTGPRLPYRRAQLLLPRAGRRTSAPAPVARTRRWRRWSAPCAAAPPSAPRAATR